MTITFEIEEVLNVSVNDEDLKVELSTSGRMQHAQRVFSSCLSSLQQIKYTYPAAYRIGTATTGNTLTASRHRR